MGTHRSGTKNTITIVTAGGGPQKTRLQKNGKPGGGEGIENRRCRIPPHLFPQHPLHEEEQLTLPLVVAVERVDVRHLGSGPHLMHCMDIIKKNHKNSSHSKNKKR